MAFVCPRCRGPLESDTESFRCLSCPRGYPLHAGIPDFRLEPDPYLSLEEDSRRTEMVLEALPRLALPELLSHYWSVSDVTPGPLRERFIASALRGEERGRRLLAVLDAGRPPKTSDVTLEIGSGTGNLLAAAGRDGRPGTVVGLDVAMRWLHLSRRRFVDLGQPVPRLLCGNAEHLPFPDRSFTSVVSLATLEFVRDRGRVLAEVARVLSPGGRAVFNTVNRFSLAEEPHVFLWGVGFLPRSLQARYVRFRRKASFENIRLLSLRELSRLAEPHFPEVRFEPPEVSDEALATLPAGKQRLVEVYRALRERPASAEVLRVLGPEWDVVLEKT